MFNFIPVITAQELDVRSLYITVIASKPKAHNVITYRSLKFDPYITSIASKPKAHNVNITSIASKPKAHNVSNDIMSFRF